MGFTSPDPLAEKYPWISPYAYCANNPIMFVDPDGRKIVLVINKREYTYTPGSNKLTDEKGTQHSLKEGSRTFEIVQAYNDVYNSGDDVLKKRVQDVSDSENVHYIVAKRDGQRNNSVAAGSDNTTVSEDEKNIKAEIGIGTTAKINLTGDRKANSETIAHELQHQYDYDIGNMKDSHFIESSATNPGEIRAVNLQNRMKNKNDTGKRTDYGGVPINPQLLE